MRKQAYLRAQFVVAHPVARNLGPKQLDFALRIAAKHRAIRVYRSRGQIVISRQAMYSGPFVREPFIVREVGELRL